MSLPDASAGCMITIATDGTRRLLACDYFVTTSSAIVAAWEAEVQGLPERKQSRWKGRLSDEGKQRSAVMCVDGVFRCRVHAQEAGCLRGFKLPVDGWAAVLSDTQYRDLVCGSNAPYIVKAMGCDPGQISSIQLIEMAQSSLDACVMADGVFDQAALALLQLQNHTGHHKRNKTVRVLTRCGEPVRR